jgi:hypothetical protein
MGSMQNAQMCVVTHHIAKHPSQEHVGQSSLIYLKYGRSFGANKCYWGTHANSLTWLPLTTPAQPINQS